MPDALDPIREQVARLTTVTESVKALLTLLAEQVRNAATLEEAQAVAAEVAAKVDELTSAVVENTPT